MRNQEKTEIRQGALALMILKTLEAMDLFMAMESRKESSRRAAMPFRFLTAPSIRLSSS